MSDPRPGFPINVISATSATGKQVGAGTGGTDIVHLFKANVIEYAADPSDADQNLAETRTDADLQINVRNHFLDGMTIGEKLVVMLGPDGIGVILVWECE